MSIIYDALKKVKATAQQPGEPDPGKTSRQMPTYLIYALAILIGILAAKLFFGFFKHPAKTLPAETKKPQVIQPQPAPVIPEPAQEIKPAPAEIPKEVPMPLPLPSFTLNGIFFSGEDGYALINNQISRVGDTVDGATVEKITLEEVELKTPEGSIKLSNRNK